MIFKAINLTTTPLTALTNKVLIEKQFVKVFIYSDSDCDIPVMRHFSRYLRIGQGEVDLCFLKNIYTKYKQSMNYLLLELNLLFSLLWYLVLALSCELTYFKETCHFITKKWSTEVSNHFELIFSQMIF